MGSYDPPREVLERSRFARPQTIKNAGGTKVNRPRAADDFAAMYGAIYLAPFLIIGIFVRRWTARKTVSLAEAQAEGDPGRKRSRFLLGIWRHDDPN
jgi:hypothetical protein